MLHQKMPPLTTLSQCSVLTAADTAKAPLKRRTSSKYITCSSEQYIQWKATVLLCAFHNLTHQQWLVERKGRNVIARKTSGITALWYTDGTKAHQKCPFVAVVPVKLVLDDVSPPINTSPELLYTKHKRQSWSFSSRRDKMLDVGLANLVIGPTTRVHNASMRPGVLHATGSNMWRWTSLARSMIAGRDSQKADQIMPKPSVPSLMDSLRARSNCSYES